MIQFIHLRTQYDKTRPEVEKYENVCIGIDGIDWAMSGCA